MSVAEQRRRPSQRLLVALGFVIIVGLILVGLIIPGRNGQLDTIDGGQGAVGTILTAALPTFLAGVFSFLSPCTLPILPAYFAFTFEAKRQQVALMTLAFFLGLATTMTLFGASASLLGSFLTGGNLRDTLAFWGGVLIIGLGIANMLGKGFSGIQMQERPSATFAGSYLFGMTFALGWSACVGPILGTLLTLLVAQGSSVLAGAVLAQIYALGLALPLFLVAVFFRQIGTGSRIWQIIRGRGFSINVFGRTLHLHTTSILSGLLLIVLGYFLASGELYRFSDWATRTPAGEWALNIETWISRAFGGL
ncbi:MAG: cytochrome c biogenesis protein CcdA [Chloroflexi bacterium]|nr:cytochrome c biogenesis protein CcdA [Chloroflexota bacterium]